MHSRSAASLPSKVRRRSAELEAVCSATCRKTRTPALTTTLIAPSSRRRKKYTDPRLFGRADKALLVTPPLRSHRSDTHTNAAGFLSRSRHPDFRCLQKTSIRRHRRRLHHIASSSSTSSFSLPETLLGMVTLTVTYWSPRVLGWPSFGTPRFAIRSVAPG